MQKSIICRSGLSIVTLRCMGWRQHRRQHARPTSSRPIESFELFFRVHVSIRYLQWPTLPYTLWGTQTQKSIYIVECFPLTFLTLEFTYTIRWKLIDSKFLHRIYIISLIKFCNIIYKITKNFIKFIIFFNIVSCGLWRIYLINWKGLIQFSFIYLTFRCFIKFVKNHI